jgi:uncharacterized phage-associated protein
MTMVRAIDVAEYLRSRGVFNSWHLQKLAYYCQAWSLAWEGAPLFEEDFEAWRDGPVCPAIRTGGLADPRRLNPAQRTLVESVVGFYGNRPTDWLIELTHREQPWVVARAGAPDGAHGSNTIQKNLMATYYGRLGLAKYQLTPEFMTALEILVDTQPDDHVVDGSDFVNWLESGVRSNWAPSTN